MIFLYDIWLCFTGGFTRLPNVNTSYIEDKKKCEVNNTADTAGYIYGIVFTFSYNYRSRDRFIK